MNGSDYARVESAIRYLEGNASEQPSLQSVAGHLGLSVFHCQRLFHRWAGVTPKDFLRVVTLAGAKELLGRSESVLDAALGSGLSGPGRLHDLFLSIEAMTPGEYRKQGAGLTIRWGMHETPLGSTLFATTERGLCAIHFVENEEQAVAELARQWPKATLVRDYHAVSTAASEVAGRMRGRIGQPLSVLFRGTAFQVKVWQALLAIPSGSVASYAQIAKAVGHPKATRAVGSAIGANELAFLIPCHRVLRTTGALGGYRWGSARKRALMVLERV